MHSFDDFLTCPAMVIVIPDLFCKIEIAICATPYMDRHIMPHFVLPQCSSVSQNLTTQVTLATSQLSMTQYMPLHPGMRIKRLLGGLAVNRPLFCLRKYQLFIIAWHCSARIFASELLDQLNLLP